MTAGFMLVTMAVIVSASLARFLRVVLGVWCLDFFQSMFTKIMFVDVAVLCSSGTVPEPAERVKVDHADRMALLVEAATA